MDGVIGSRPTMGQRVSALAALVAVAGAVCVALVGVATNWQSFVALVAGLVVLVVAGWYVVSRRGRARRLAVVVCAAGFGVVVVGFVAADIDLARLLTVAILASVSVGAARVALNTRRTAADSSTGAARPQAPRHPVLIMNLKSGGGKAERYGLAEECRHRNIEPIVLRPGDDLVELAESAVARGADVIGMAGGDGSQALVAGVASRHDIPHVVVPAGTRNHFALDLGLDRDDVVGALDAFEDGVERVVDLAAVNGRVFVNNATAGLYAKIVQSPEYRDAKRQTAMDMLPQLLGPDATPLDLRYDGPDGEKHQSAHVILVSNNPYELGSVDGLGTRARIDLGVLGIATVTIANAGEAAVFVGYESIGRPQQFNGFLQWSAPRFRIDADGPVEIGLDGEALKLEPPLLFETRPQALRVRLPRHAPGQSPAARAVHLLSQSTLSELAQMAAGHFTPSG